ncbi:HEPN family nuclease [Ruthenibacterium lactatiformans]|uniref:HEPN family nuclease n=1 Tax=Ruthenibacterium lactatiformans TaxID=1550024 RepID=UPI003AF1A47C
MSEYRDFKICTICRSIKNYQQYSGDFEVTMLLNTLYLAVMHPLEKRINYNLKSRKMREWLDKEKIVDYCENEYKTDDVIQKIRNGLAHFNIRVKGFEGQISEIVVYARNQGIMGICKECKKCKKSETCRKVDECAKCEKGYLKAKYVTKPFDDYSDVICKFTFSVDQLEKLCNYIVSKMPPLEHSQNCKGCPYLPKEILSTNAEERKGMR